MDGDGLNPTWHTVTASGGHYAAKFRFGMARGGGPSKLRDKEINFNIQLPEYWQEARGQEIMIVEIDEESADWDLVVDNFKNTLANKKILSIKRIQHMKNFRNFSIKKTDMQKQNGINGDNELYLFHGTTPDLASTIELQNLDPRIYGTNGTMYGKGTYFAVDALYSHRFTKYDDEGHRFMFVAKVLTGNSCAGKPAYTRPPPIRPSDKNSPLYDSCVDNPADPTIYCMFQDNQFYIEYLIEYI